MSNKKSNSSTSENLPNDKNFQKPIASNTNPRSTTLSLKKRVLFSRAFGSVSRESRQHAQILPIIVLLILILFIFISRFLKRFWMWIIQLVWCLQELTNSDAYVNSSMNLELESSFHLQFYLSISNSKKTSSENISDLYCMTSNLKYRKFWVGKLELGFYSRIKAA